MNWTGTTRRLAVTLLLALGVASCDYGSTTELTEPTSHGTVGDPQELLGLFGSRTVLAVNEHGQIQRYELAREPVLSLDLRNLRVSELIGIDGGTVTLLGHRITVPAGAVDAPTLFTLIALPTGYVQVDISALAGTLWNLVNVGEQGFAEPVRLDLTYSRATNVDDPRDLVILRLNPWGMNAVHQVMPTRVDTRRERVSTWLDHFSGYCVAM